MRGKILLRWEENISFVRLFTEDRRWETPRFRYLHQYHMTVMIDLFFTSLLLLLPDVGREGRQQDMGLVDTEGVKGHE
jgi:hypothetical protein